MVRARDIFFIRIEQVTEAGRFVTMAGMPCPGLLDRNRLRAACSIVPIPRRNRADDDYPPRSVRIALPASPASGGSG